MCVSAIWKTAHTRTQAIIRGYMLSITHNLKSSTEDNLAATLRLHKHRGKPPYPSLCKYTAIFVCMGFLLLSGTLPYFAIQWAYEGKRKPPTVQIEG